jgi:N-acetylmuramoyl-L-alanine amidase
MQIWILLFSLLITDKINLNKLKYYILFFILTCISVLSADKLDVIVIDAGHGGKDPGTIGLSGIHEKVINLPIALKLGELIQKDFPGIKIIQTRTKDEFIEVKERSVIANNNKAKLFISIHANFKKMEETEKNGFEIYIINPERFPEAVSYTLNENSLLKFEQYGRDSTDRYIFSSLAQNGYRYFSELLASGIETSMLSMTQLASRGVMQAGFWVLVGSSMPVVLVECGYLSDSNDEEFLSSPEGQYAVAAALYQGFVNYKMVYESE